jgi:AbrB family looped-hinge helix DNA binding protein
MPTLKLHYDGWLALPAGMREKLGLNSGDRVEAELVDGALVLRPVAKAGRPAKVRDADPSSVEDPETTPATADAAQARRKPGRPRKVPTAAGEGGAAPKKARGRPRRAVPGSRAGAAPPEAVLGPPKLLKKADLEARTATADTPVPATRLATRVRPDGTPQPVERRPFRNVEVRALGPGRGHNSRDRDGPMRQSNRNNQ